MRRLLALLCGGALCLSLAGCNQEALYDDADALGSSSNSYSAVRFVETTINSTRTGSVGKLSGMYELWSCRAEAGEQAVLIYTFEVTNGKAKLILADPEGNVETLVECFAGDDAAQGTLTLNLSEGMNRIKVVGAEDAALTWELEIDKGSWSDS